MVRVTVKGALPKWIQQQGSAAALDGKQQITQKKKIIKMNLLIK